MNELIPITYNNDAPRVSGRELHTFLEVGTEYAKWFDRMTEYGFTEGTDFSPFLTKSTGGRPTTDHQLSIDMAKELCMLQRNEKGKQARQYFLDLERAWNSPEQLMARALKAAEYVQSQLQNQVTALQPKADYYDTLVDRNMLTGLRDTARELHMGQNKFIAWLLAKNYVYRKGERDLRPYAGKGDGLFELREWTSATAGRAGLQLMVTPAGRAKFIQVLNAEMAATLQQ